jgi:hypothetical protein
MLSKTQAERRLIKDEGRLENDLAVGLVTKLQWMWSSLWSAAVCKLG